MTNCSKTKVRISAPEIGRSFVAQALDVSVIKGSNKIGLWELVELVRLIP
jgi:hypothetical protein